MIEERDATNASRILSSERVYGFAWWLTRVVAVILVLITCMIAWKSHSQRSSGLPATVRQGGSSIYLRAQPGSAGRIITVLDGGEKVLVQESTSLEGEEWFRVQTTMATVGWVPSNQIELNFP